MTVKPEKISTAAKNYANALLEVAKSGKDSFESISKDMAVINEALNSSSDLQTALENPAINTEVKNDIINSVFGEKLSQEAINFLKILVEKKRITDFAQIFAEFNSKYCTIQNIQPATIISAIALSTEQQAQIIEKLSKKLNKTILPKWETNIDLIAGITIQIEDNILDMSLKNRIEKLSKSLMLK